ncbi:DNA repair protein RadA [Apibacter muscae]|uniref:DNA repair protein RadA n=1 Tax=Apibacter muscae TaxID=2509004 RepID=A0A563DDZ8_9FLAO|nr:DNA repair protein RadA [Apibacter muscae]TWP28309.1 DNA repair protein RadA [Apibacter muscae]TWP30732.1 DNA repair protein RadA [Apibacter muscae]
MSKNTKTSFFCQNCGAQYSQWMGQCKACGEWNTIVEEIIEKRTKRNFPSNKSISSNIIKIHDIETVHEDRIISGDSELDFLLGGGIVPGSVILIGGEPGIGKSTLLLQLSLQINKKVLYVSGEESAIQIKMRGDRIKYSNSDCYILTETSIEKIIKKSIELKPELLIIDSIQTLSSSYIDSSPGSISQIRECASELIKYAKSSSTPIFLVGHITKDGTIAGPKILEHMVDVVLQFEGDRNYMFRLLRSHKNRYGSTSELGIYEMFQDGLRQVKNPSEILISKKDENLSGNAIAVTLEGLRPMLVEIQALVSTAVYGTPQRATTGFDIKRLNILLAVLEKRAGFHLGSKDVFLNITGGIKIDDPAVDLGVICAILSSNENVSLPDNCLFAGEVGLSGEIRAINRIEQRILEAEKLGYDVIFISKYNKIDIDKFNIKIELVGKVDDVYKMLF